MSDPVPVQLVADKSKSGQVVELTATPTRINQVPMTGASGRLPAGGLDVNSPDTIVIHTGAFPLQIQAASDVIVGLGLQTHIDDAAAAPYILTSKARGTQAAPTIVQSGDAVRIDSAVAFDGVDYEEVGRLKWSVGGTPGSNDMPGKLEIMVTPDGDVTPAVAITVAQDKAVTFAGAVNFVAGSVAKAALALPTVAVLTEVVTAASLVDGGAAVGTKTLTGTLPAGAVILGTKVLVTAGFAGDVSAVAILGDGITTDRYNTGTINVFATAATGVQSGKPKAANELQIAAVSPVVTVTSNADITPVLAGGGSMTVSIYYIQTV